MNYDETKVLTDYVWWNYRSLMTDFERLVGNAIIGRLKADAAKSKRLAAILHRRWARTGDPDVESALAGGAEAFRQRVADRVMTEHRDEVDLNRCPECNRIPRTPRAKQCLWCHHSNCVGSQAVSALLGSHAAPSRMTALQVTKSFRMHATSATFLGFPAATSRS